MSRTKQTFIQGTLILLAAGIVNRLLGFVPRIALPRVIGAEGVGLYQMGYPFLILLLTVITGGLPLAIAKLVAEAESEGNEERVRTILRTSILFSVSLGIMFTAFSMLGAPWLTRYLFTDQRVLHTFVAMSPIILLVSVSAVFRGYFQGRQNMIPTAASQVVETVVRIFCMLAFAYLLLPYGLEFAAAGAMIGVTFGEIGGMLVLLFQYARTKRTYVAASTDQSPKRPSAAWDGLQAFRHLMRISLPVTASRLVGSASYFFESITIVQSLAIAGVATAAATTQYGALQGMVIPVLLLPSALTYSLSVSLVPSLSEAAARSDTGTIHKLLRQSIRLALVTGAPFAVMMYVLAEPICYYLYKDAEVGVMLKMMAPVALFIYVQGPLAAALQALDRPGTALVNTLLGSVIKLSLILILASKPQFGILGAIMAINVNITLVTLMHWNSVSRFLKFSMRSSDFSKVLAAMAIMGACCYFVMNLNWSDNALLRFMSASVGGTVLYLLCTVWLGLIDRTDFKRILSLRRK